MVSNVEGLREYFNPEGAIRGFAEADRKHCGETFRVEIPSPEKVGEIARGEHGICTPPTPKGNEEGSESSQVALNPTEYLKLEDIPEIEEQLWTDRVEGIETQYDTYTDGSLKTKTMRTGAAYTVPSTGKKVAIKYTGKASILRAELVAILANLQATAHDTPINLHTDSLVSLLGIRRVVRRKGNARGVKEAPIIKKIFDELLQRTAPTNLRKVKSHVGIRGNETADRLAVAAAEGELKEGAIWVEVNTPEATREGAVWIANQAGDRETDPGAAVRKHRQDCRIRRERENTGERGYGRMADIPTVIPAASNAFVKTTTLTRKEKAWVWKARANAVATRKRRAQWGRLAPGESATCPICNNNDDTVGHRLGGCTGQEIRGMHTNRHDVAVKMIVCACRRGARGGYHVEYDAGKLEDGSTKQMIHDRFLKPNETARGLEVGGPAPGWMRDVRPDIMVYQGVRPGKLDALLSGASPPGNFKIQMVEVGYCNDWKWAQTMAETAEKYVELAARMKARGWPTEFKQVALGVRGCVYTHLGDVLK